MKSQEKDKSKNVRRRYDAEFKSSALRLISQGRSVADVSRSLGVAENLLHKWKSAAKTASPKAAEDMERDELLRRIRRLEEEQEILKKALSIFSRE